MSTATIGWSVVAMLLAGCAGSPLPNTPPNRPAADLLGSPYRALHIFAGPPRDGSAPNGQLISVNGTLYGTTSTGGRDCYHHGRSTGCGAVFAITTSGQYRLLYSFQGKRDGANPVGGLLPLDGLLYGVTSGGGARAGFSGPCSPSSGGCGTIFSVSPSGEEHVLYSFRGGSDGTAPSGGLTSIDGTLYGVTSAGGVTRNCKGYDSLGCGTVFAVSSSGNERIVYRFPGGRDGSFPSGELLALGGKLFGTTLDGGDFDDCGNGCGTIFDVTTSGVERVLHRFGARAHGSQPGGLIGLNGLLYGTTFNGGNVRGSCETGGCGTVFEATAAGSVQTIYSSKSISDGAGPQSLAAVNGLLYVTASYGGNVCGPSGSYGGAIFAITTSGKEHRIYRFPCSGGVMPSPGLLALGDFLYGTTSLGATHGAGTIFTLRI